MSCRLLPLLSLILVSPSLARAAAVGTTQPTAWPGGAAAAVSITMDDGYASQWRLMAPMLEKRGFRGTFFLVTDWLDAEDHWPRWQVVAGQGHEIGSHGVTHKPLSVLGTDAIMEELKRSRELIQNALGPEHGQSFAFPLSAADESLARLAANAGYGAARVAGDTINPEAPPEMHLVQAFHPSSETSVAEMTGWVDQVLESGGWLVIGVHGVMDPRHRYSETQEGWEPVPMKHYAALLKRISRARKHLWVAPFGEVSRFIRQRESASASVEEVSSSRIRVRLRGDDRGGPVALHTSVPQAWSKVRVAVDGQEPFTIAARRDAGSAAPRIVRYQAVPPARVVLSPARPPAR